MLSKTIIAASALLSLAAAVPMPQQEKRDVVWETSTSWDVTTMHVYTTVWLAPGEAAPTAAEAAPTHYGHHGHHEHQHKKPKPTATAQPTHASPPPAQSTVPAQTPSPSSPAAPETTTYAPPPAPKPKPTKTTTAGGSGTSPQGTVYTGDITYYDVGLGSCGYTNTDSENVVAIAVDMMIAGNGANPNDNPWCGKTITISYAGQTHTAEVVDTCEGCSGASIDLSPTLFKAVAPNGNGRVHGVEWWFSN